jgi:hypothetical protein
MMNLKNQGKIGRNISQLLATNSSTSYLLNENINTRLRKKKIDLVLV